MNKSFFGISALCGLGRPQGEVSSPLPTAMLSEATRSSAHMHIHPLPSITQHPHPVSFPEVPGNPTDRPSDFALPPFSLLT